MAPHARPVPSHSRYLLVNLHDLAMFSSNHRDRLAGRALRSGLRYARWSGHLRARRRSGDSTIAVLPDLLRAAGRSGDAAREAQRLASLGWAPAIGWPGYEDDLWSRLTPGTP